VRRALRRLSSKQRRLGARGILPALRAALEAAEQESEDRAEGVGSADEPETPPA